MIEYQKLVRHTLIYGNRKENRTGIETLSAFNYNYQIDIRNGFPLLTTKKVSWKNIVIENLWFLSGQTDISLLHKHNCRFWDPWINEHNQVPSAYGSFWRHFGPNNNDQIQFVIDQLKSNPYSRRHVVSAWDPNNAQTSTLPPCHAFWVLNVQNTEDDEQVLCLHLTQRSADVALGIPYNIAGYSFLLELIGHITKIKPAIFAHSLIDAHIYNNHVSGLKLQLTRKPKPPPKLTIDPSIQSLDDITDLLNCSTEEILEVFKLTNYKHHSPIEFEVAV